MIDFSTSDAAVFFVIAEDGENETKTQGCYIQCIYTIVESIDIGWCDIRGCEIFTGGVEITLVHTFTESVTICKTTPAVQVDVIEEEKMSASFLLLLLLTVFILYIR